ncbi:MAG TPA: glycoside hydrolase family 2 TIM barrel-domain containing protein [Gemmataceae bacterium]|nr:glycoside hydrolase family 2 TIM barrel-domain containing protein [Gemmataceae bacterium]
MRIRLATFFALLAALPALAADWKPAPAPLMTRWGKAVTPENAWKEYPRPQLVRKEWLNLNGLWDYAITEKEAAKPEKWAGKILVPFCVESALSGVGKTVTKDQNLWYRRTVLVPPSWKGQRLLLHFQAVDFEATVWLNGKELGTHRGMSDPFSFDVTDALQAGENELVVRVWDPTDDGVQPRGKQVKRPGGIWYTPVTGIWQTVWMEPVNDGHIARLSITPDVDAGTVTFRVEGPGIRAGDTIDVIHQIEFELTDARRQPADRAVTLKVANPRLWSPDSPRLYNATVVLTRGGEQLDTVTSYFAMRKVSAAKDDNGTLRLMLNNKPLFQIGPLDQGWWPDGLLTPPSDEAMTYDLKVLKQLGLNMLRKHIKVEPARYYYHCDRLGLLVWQDMPSGGIPARNQHIRPNAKDDASFTDEEKKQFRTELKAMIDHLRFFPCIYCWVPFNEGWGQHDTNDILKWVKEYDPTRLVNGPSGWTDRDYGDMKDMHMYPGPGMFPVMPDRVSVLGEFGGLGLPVPDHLWLTGKKNWGYRTFESTQALRENYRRLLLQLHPLIGKGLAAAVYTQTTDVEVEVNGYMTYDREVLKFDPADMAKWHKTLFGPPPELREVIATSEKAAQKWRYTTTRPADSWNKPEFDVGPWSEGEGGFGTPMTPGSVVRTTWNTPDIWLRREVDLKDVASGDLLWRVHHDEDVEIFVNGVLAGRARGYVTDYGLVGLTPEGRKAFKAGKNTIAVHCKQTSGGQYIDVGLVRIVPAK